MVKCRDCGENMIYVEQVKGTESYNCKLVDGVLELDSNSYEFNSDETYGANLKCPKCGYEENVSIEVDFR